VRNEQCYAGTWRISLLAEGDRTPFFLSLRSETFQIERNLSYQAGSKNPPSGGSFLFYILYICLSMGFLSDISVNLLSDAIWAIGGYMIVRLAFLKKTIFFQAPTFKKISSVICDLPVTFKTGDTLLHHPAVHQSHLSYNFLLNLHTYARPGTALS
jgi:hypothetical protein